MWAIWQFVQTLERHKVGCFAHWVLTAWWREQTRDLCDLPVCEGPGASEGDAAEAWAYRENKVTIMQVTHLTEEGQKDEAFLARQRDGNEELQKC